MFDWIGDAIDWIGDGISSLWDSTIGGATEAIGDWIWEAMFEWLFNLIYGGIADLFELVNVKYRCFSEVTLFRYIIKDMLSLILGDGIFFFVGTSTRLSDSFLFVAV